MAPTQPWCVSPVSPIWLSSQGGSLLRRKHKKLTCNPLRAREGRAGGTQINGMHNLTSTIKWRCNHVALLNSGMQAEWHNYSVLHLFYILMYTFETHLQKYPTFDGELLGDIVSVSKHHDFIVLQRKKTKTRDECGLVTRWGIPQNGNVHYCTLQQCMQIYWGKGKGR